MADPAPDFDSPDRRLVARLVREYCATQRHPSLLLFQIHGPFTTKSWRNTEESNKIGCYAIYDEDENLLYIGMSTKNIGDRLRIFFRASTQSSEHWRNESPSSLVEIIEVSEAWEAPSLEEFLVVKSDYVAARRRKLS